MDGEDWVLSRDNMREVISDMLPIYIYCGYRCINISVEVGFLPWGWLYSQDDIESYATLFQMDSVKMEREYVLFNHNKRLQSPVYRITHT